MLTEEEKQSIKPFVTSATAPVFGFRNVPPVVVGAMFGRYSRSELGARELLLREFLAEQDVAELIGNIEQSEVDPAKADAFFGRVLDQYGDDSVAELGGTAIAIEQVSNVLVKMIEDRRIGLSPLEKSSRYVRFDRKDDKGKYPYYSDPSIAKAGFGKEYESLMTELFDTYSKFIPPLMEFLKTRFPQAEGQSDKAYTNALRAQACDVTRYLLPMSTQTNVGLVGNGRAFEYLVYNLRASDLNEAHQYATYITEALDQLIPAFIRRSKTERGQGYVDHLAETKAVMKAASAKHLTHFYSGGQPTVRLIDYDKEGELKVAASLLYEHSAMTFDEVQKALAKNPKLIKEIIEDALSPRKHRTHKPPRPFEHSYYQFEVTCDIGAYRDLHRHRVLTQQRQPFTTDLGYSTPSDIVEAGLAQRYQKVMDKAARLYQKIVTKLPEQAQYVVPFGYVIRFTMRMNAREAYHLCELRSTVQGHPSYRLVAQEMAREIEKVHPTLGKNMMITWEGYDSLARIASEQRIESKERSQQQSIEK
jgi:thymidylate synthase ThyX